MKKKYKDMTVGEGLITALQQAIDYEKGKNVQGSKKIKKVIGDRPKVKKNLTTNP